MRNNFENKENGSSMIEMLEKVKQPLNAVLRRQAQVFRCCQLAFAPRRNTENQVTEAPLGARQRQCALAQSGRSMIEMLGVLAIIGVLSVGGIAGYSKAMQRYRINKTIEQITLIAGNVRTFFAPQKSYNGLVSYCQPNQPCLAKKAKLVPDEMWVEGKGWAQNVWGASVVVSEQCRNQTECDSGIYGAFDIGYSDVPEEACIALLTQDWTNAGVGLIHVYNNDSAEARLRGVPSVIIPPVNMDMAIRLCSCAASDPDDEFLDSDGDVDSVSFTFDCDVNSDYWKYEIDVTATRLNGN